MRVHEIDFEFLGMFETACGGHVDCIGPGREACGADPVGDGTVVTLRGIGSDQWTTNPVMSPAWTVAQVNALQAGIKRAGDYDVDVTQVYVVVNMGNYVTYAHADGPTGTNTLTWMTYGATMTYAWDANGNLDTKTGGWDYDWNAENLMTVAKLNGV